MKMLCLKRKRTKALFTTAFTLINIIIVALFLVPERSFHFMSYGIYSYIFIPIGLGFYIWFVREIFHSKHLVFTHKSVWLFAASSTFLNSIITGYANIAYKTGLNSGCIESAITKSDAYYFSLVTFTTLGYGDFSPKPEYRLLFASEAFFGYLFFGVIVGLILSLTVSKDRGKRA